MLVSPDGLVLEQAVRLGFSASKNKAEYEALLVGLRSAKRLGADHLQIFCDSQLIANQIFREYQAHDERMSAYLLIIQNLLFGFESTTVEQIGKEHNSYADILAKLATTLESEVQRNISVETLSIPSFQNQELYSVHSTSAKPSWMDPLIDYIKNSKLPEDKKEMSVIKRKSLKYWISAEAPFTDSRIQDHTYFVFTPALSRTSYLRFMKGYVGVIWEGDL
jgi:ribonuclease HI